MSHLLHSVGNDNVLYSVVHKNSRLPDATQITGQSLSTYWMLQLVGIYRIRFTNSQIWSGFKAWALNSFHLEPNTLGEEADKASRTDYISNDLCLPRLGVCSRNPTLKVQRLQRRFSAALENVKGA